MNSIKSHDVDQVMETQVGQELWTRSQKQHSLCLALPQGGHFILFQYCDVSLSSNRVEKVRILCNQTNFSLVSESKICRTIAHDLDGAQDGYTQLHTFFTRLLKADADALLAVEDHIYAFEDGLFTSKKAMKTAPQIIVNLRRNLLRMKRYYQQLQSIINQVFNEEALSNHITQLLNTVENLQELTIQARETYQGQIGIQQNDLMKLFTIITTIFMPLTVIVGWYGMNFDTMPELHWPYGYLYVIALSILVSSICVLIFKWKKWFN